MKIGLSLGGGGALGYAHIGALRAFREVGITIDLINGSSMGAIVGGAYALYNDVDHMTTLVEEVVKNINVRTFNVFKSSEHHPFLRNWLSTAFCDITLLRPSILSHKNDVKALNVIFGEGKFTDTLIPFSCVAVDLLSGEIVVIDTGSLVDGILPSISLPGVFPPIERDGRLLVDGRVLADVPVKELRDQGADYVIAIRLAPKAAWWYQTGSDLLNLVEMMKESMLTQWEQDQADFNIEMNLPDIQLLDFESYDHAIFHGYQTAKKICPELKRRISTA